MSKPVVPPDLRPIFDRLGSSWAPEEVVRVKEWLWADSQLVRLLITARRHLEGCGATAEDAEDALGEFYEKKLDQVISSYDPGKGAFWSYLSGGLRWFCQDVRKRVAREHSTVGPMATGMSSDEALEFGIVDKETVEDEVIRGEVAATVRRGCAATTRAEWEEKAERLCSCVNGLKPEYRVVVVMYYFQEMPFREIASRLGISESTAKTRCCRARQTLARMFAEPTSARRS